MNQASTLSHCRLQGWREVEASERCLDERRIEASGNSCHTKQGSAPTAVGDLTAPPTAPPKFAGGGNLSGRLSQPPGRRPPCSPPFSDSIHFHWIPAILIASSPTRLFQHRHIPTPQRTLGHTYITPHHQQRTRQSTLTATSKTTSQPQTCLTIGTPSPRLAARPAAVVPASARLLSAAALASTPPSAAALWPQRRSSPLAMPYVLILSRPHPLLRRERCRGRCNAGPSNRALTTPTHSPHVPRVPSSPPLLGANIMC